MEAHGPEPLLVNAKQEEGVADTDMAEPVTEPDAKRQKLEPKEEGLAKQEKIEPLNVPVWEKALVGMRGDVGMVKAAP
jgi:hypothetical protein